jgi:formylglycine-generating enzyme required for sulfatase activity
MRPTALTLLLALAGCPGRPEVPPVPKILRQREVTIATNILLSADHVEPVETTFTLLEVPGGTFRFGDPEGSPSPREVEVGTFWLGRCEVTWDEYLCFYLNEDSLCDGQSWPSLSYVAPDRGMGLEGYPVISIQPHMAAKYCEWLSRQTGWSFRLPTEEEWEYACLAGGTLPRPGDPIDEHAWSAANSAAGSADDAPKNQPAGEKKPNAWGFHDMLGGVWEITAQGVLRGGSWNDPPDALQAHLRKEVDPAWNLLDPSRPRSVSWFRDAPFVGFRLAGTPPPD